MFAHEQFARLVAAEGIDVVFGVLGDGNMHWVAAYRELPGGRWHNAWHEAGAVWMADGYATRTGAVGVATVTMGPGLAQALPALMTAARARRRVLVVTASVPDTQPPHAQYSRQAELVAAAGARYVAVEAASELADGLARALHSARSGVPAVLAVALEVFEHAQSAEQTGAASGAPPAAPTEPGEPGEAGEAQLDAAAAAITAAERPLFLLGAGVLDSGCLSTALDLGRRVGAAFATTVGGRTALPDEPFELGVLGMMANPVARALAASADVVVILGVNLDRYNSDGTALGRDALVVRVDRRPPAELWSPGDDVLHLTAELPHALTELSTRIGVATSTGFRTDSTRAALDDERRRQAALADLPTADGPNPWAVVAELDRQLPGAAHVVVGIGHFWYFVAPHLSPRPNRSMHFACGFASIGQAIPVGVGAAAARRAEPVVVVEGDGSAVMNLQELQAAVRNGSDLLVVILDNAAYGSEYHKLALAGFDVAASTFVDVPFDIAAVAAAMGAETRRADDLDEFAAALTELLPVPGVRLIDARISVATMSETYIRQHGAGPRADGTASTPSHSAVWGPHVSSEEPPR